jgi:acyl-CoA thioester hydrolase
MENKPYTRRALYYETDQMGIVHHSNYIRFFEEARNEFMFSIGCNIREIEKKGYVIPNVDAYARYIKPIKFYDEFTVEVFLVRFNGSRLEFDYEIHLKSSGVLAATGHTTHCFATKDLKPVSIKRIMPEVYSTIKQNLKTETTNN